MDGTILRRHVPALQEQRGFRYDNEPGAFAGSVLLQASFYPEPTHNPEFDAQFDKNPHWGVPAARIEAANGLIVLARHPTCAGPHVLEAIERLSKDHVPAVRFQVAAHIIALYRTGPELMRKIIENMCREEPSRGVLLGLLGGALGLLAGTEPVRIAGLTKTIFDRVIDGPGADEVRGLCVDIFSDLCIWRGHILCDEIARQIASNPATYPNEANRVLMKLRKPLTHGPTNRSDPDADAVRKRAFDLLAGLLHSGHEGLRKLEAHNIGLAFNEWPQHDQDKANSLLRLVDGVGYEVYFASGAYDGERQGRNGSNIPNAESARFYQEASAILDELMYAGIPSVTYHLIETLAYFVTLEPRNVLLRIGEVVQAGTKAGYQFESLAADLMVELVERYLAEYRTLMKEDEQCRLAMIEILDVFVQAGWPSTRQLVYRLEEIFR
jgi:hypothetical protein